MKYGVFVTFQCSLVLNDQRWVDYDVWLLLGVRLLLCILATLGYLLYIPNSFRNPTVEKVLESLFFWKQAFSLVKVDGHLFSWF